VKTNFFIIIFLIILIVPTFSVNIRGEVSSILTIKTEKEETDFNMFDLTGLFITESPFVKGLELTITIPDDLARYRDSFMVNIYYKLDSFPDKNIKSYSGNLLFSKLLTVSKKMFISIPMSQNTNNDLIPGSFITDILDQTVSPLLISIIPVMKGIPSSVQSSIFKLEVIPVLSNKGILDLSINGSPSENLYNIILDGKQVTNKTEYILEEGLHQILIQSDIYKEINRSFVISRGIVTDINLFLEQLISTVLFEAPDGVIIILDGKKLNSFPGIKIDIEKGEHVVRMELGDYFLSKKFTIEKEKDYKISLSLDILIQEN
jgi:hypothetical protein